MSRYTKTIPNSGIKIAYQYGFAHGFSLNPSTFIPLDTDYTKELDDNKCIEIRDISLEEAKKIIALYFKGHDGEDIGYNDLFENLHIDLKLIVDACEELEAEGKIG